MKALDLVTGILVIVGAINWGLIGMAKFNLVAALFGQTALASIVYSLVGIAAIYQAWRMLTTRTPVLAHGYSQLNIHLKPPIGPQDQEHLHEEQICVFDRLSRASDYRGTAPPLGVGG